MKIVVIGAGGVGGYFGGLLANADQEVIFVARGPHLAALRERGLQIRSIHGDFHVSPAAATDRMAEVGPAELALVCVKDFHMDQVIPEMAPLVGKHTMILPLLNGVRAAERLIAVFGRERVLGGTCSVVAYIAEPGVIQQTSGFRRVAFGEWDGRTTPRTKAVYEAFQATGTDVELSADIRKAMWTKYLFITAYSGVASVVRLPAGKLQNCPETMEMLRQAMLEIEAVARAKDVALDDDVVAKTMAFIQGLAPTATSSMQRDVEAGRMFELEALTGSLVRAGQETGTLTPVNSFIYAALKPQELHAQEKD